MTQQLPSRPHIDHLRKQAKDLLAEARQGSLSAWQRIRKSHPRQLTDASLADAQLVVAREYGFESWPKLKERVDGLPESLKRAIAELRAGKPCILFDDEGRENEGDYVLAAEKVSAEAINFITRHGRGTLCLSLDQARSDRLGLRLINPDRKDPAEPAFMVSIDAVAGVTTGVSAFDRAETIRQAVSDNAGPAMVRSPGHVFPLLAHPGGIAERAGHTEGSLELMRLANLRPAAVICEILKDDGTMARLPDLIEESRKHGIALVRISEL